MFQDALFNSLMDDPYLSLQISKSRQQVSVAPPCICLQLQVGPGLTSGPVLSRAPGGRAVPAPRRPELRQEPAVLQQPGGAGAAGLREPAAAQQPEPELQLRRGTAQRAQHHPHRSVSDQNPA